MNAPRGSAQPRRSALVLALLLNPAFVGFSEYILGEVFGISFHTVRKERRRLEASGLIPSVSVRYCRDGLARDTTLIGK